MELRWWIAIGAAYLIIAVLFAGVLYEAMFREGDENELDGLGVALVFVFGLFWPLCFLFAIGAALYRKIRKNDGRKEENE